MEDVTASGGYVLIKLSPSGGLLIDDRTGQQTGVDFFSTGPEYCVIRGIGFPWVIADCGENGTQLYSIPKHAYHTLPSRFAGACTAMCSPRVGRSWIEWANAMSVGPCCSTVSYRYQSVLMGQVRQDPTTATTVPDLDSAGLSRRICSPLRVPRSYGAHANGLGSLQFDGSFALAMVQLPAKPNPLFSNAPSGTEEYLERCGSKLHMKVGLYPIFSRQMVMWTEYNRTNRAADPPIAGVELPSLKRFLIQTPSHTSSEPALSVALGSRHLYVFDGNSNRVWTAPIPPSR